MHATLSSSLVLCAALLGLTTAAPDRFPKLHTVQIPAAGASCKQPNARPVASKRAFASPAVEKAITELVPRFLNPELGQLFSNALPNVLDTTVVVPINPRTGDTMVKDVLCDGRGHCKPAVFIVTGDIDAMWQRDSTNQVLPYLALLWDSKNDTLDSQLRTLFRGVIAQQTANALLDPYANAFQRAGASASPNVGDSTNKPAFAGTTVDAMISGIFERKYELDSQCNVLHLAARYYNASKDLVPFLPAEAAGEPTGPNRWLEMVQLILDTMKEQQKSSEEMGATDGDVYSFSRSASQPTDTLNHGRGWPARHTGMVKSAFRGSDDAVKFPFNIPENAMAVMVLRGLTPLLDALTENAPEAASLKALSLRHRALSLANEIDAGIKQHGIMKNGVDGSGSIYAYEVDGYGNQYFMDDANVPSLLAMPFYGYVGADDEMYMRTRAAVLSHRNPWWFNGTAASGVGGPHNGLRYVWPMAIVSQGWTALSDGEVRHCLDVLLASAACTGLVHESFDQDNFGSFTRSWFAWANSYAASFILKVTKERPHLVLRPAQK